MCDRLRKYFTACRTYFLLVLRKINLKFPISIENNKKKV